MSEPLQHEGLPNLRRAASGDPELALVNAAPAPDLVDFVASCHRQATAVGSWTLVTLPVPVVPAEALLGWAHEIPELRRWSFFWAPAAHLAPGRSREVVVGLGAAVVLEEMPLEILRTSADELWPRLSSRLHPSLEERGAAPPLPRLFGGMAFTAAGARQPPWQELGSGGFSLPRFLYRRSGGAATLTVALEAGDDARAARDLAFLEALLAGPLAPGAPPAGLDVPLDVPLRLTSLPQGRWESLVRDIRGEILAGRFRKIVLARRSDLEFEAPVDAARLLHRLEEESLGCTRFAFLRDRSTFLGATPERLVRRRARTVDTEALAGSIATGTSSGNGGGNAERLLHSLKDLDEHRLVVQHIAQRLETLCRNLEWSAEPQVRELRDVLHLLTPFRGELIGETHVLSLVAALHPTPAVGGVPVARALDWILEHEPEARGWYAGPVGWFDAAGDGEFAVALRSCLLHGPTASLFAGSGIVLDSNPALEYQESGWKLRPLLHALGAEAP